MKTAMGPVKVDSWKVIVLLALGLFSLLYHQALVGKSSHVISVLKVYFCFICSVNEISVVVAEARVYLLDDEHPKTRDQRMARKEMMISLWWTKDYAGVRRSKPVHNSLEP